MLTRVEIENFRCLKSVKVPLRPLTVLVGPNDSGKSSFLDALFHLTANRGFPVRDHWRLEKTTHPRIFASGGGISRVEIGPNGLSIEPTGARSLVQPGALFSLPSTGVPMLSQGAPDSGGPPELGRGGEHTPALLDFILRRHRKHFDSYVEAMRSLVPGLDGVEVATPDASKRRVDIVIENGLRIEADFASSGVRLLLFFVALAYHPVPPRLILIEEPENGVHPKRLEDVIRLLREITQGKHGDHAAQIVLTTHSPHLLDSIDPETDQVLVFRRDEDGSRTAEPADAERLKNFLDEFMLGEVWFNEGEAGLVAKGK